MRTMRAKLKVGFVQECFWGKDKEKSSELITFNGVCKNKYDETGLDEDNTFAKFSPSADFRITITNPALWGSFEVGQNYYVDFTEAMGQ